MSQLRVILGDQLTPDISSLSGMGADDVILMAEVAVEATYVKHHKKKIAFIFSAMRHFCEALRANGHTVRYITFDDPDNTGSLSGEVARACHDLHPTSVVITHPGEYRVLHDCLRWSDTVGCPVDLRDDARFYCGLSEFAEWAAGRKQLRMEYFYRLMRQNHNVLMDGDQPEGGQWNYDAENRKPPKDSLFLPQPFKVKPDALTIDVLRLVEAHFPDHFGTLEPFHYAVTAEDARAVLNHFIAERLPDFGSYQDAMLQGEPWMYHAHISLYLNVGLLSPQDCVAAAEAAYGHGHAPLNAVEGFIRQVIGWREYVRGLYWLKMPDYGTLNHLNATRPLPDFFWSADTDMNCLKQCISETRDHAYAHHIQRLMVIGNFSLLAGLDPKDVNEWFLVVYADAFEWVEMPNVTGMALFADGGIMASKPYAASGSYINKMSDYCKSCRYKVTVKTGPDACPFNYLYWDFMTRHRDTLAANPRIGMIYRSYDKMAEARKQEIAADATRFLEAL